MTTFDEAAQTEHAERRREEPATSPDPRAGTPAPAPSSLTRASDAERAEVVARLHHALGEGRLDLAETDARVTAAYQSCHRSELVPLLADLPDAGHTPRWAAPSAAPTWGVLWTCAVWRARTALLGAAGSGATSPTAAQCRIAAALTALAAMWVVACAFLGAALVGS